jgi:hypothetical protein
MKHIASFTLKAANFVSNIQIIRLNNLLMKKEITKIMNKKSNKKTKNFQKSFLCLKANKNVFLIEFK